jgi:hypothetical protein
VNAIPSGTRAPRTRRSGRASLRDVANITGPLLFRVQAGRLVLGTRGDSEPPRIGSISGSRLAKRAGRGVPVARLTVQGRVGQHSRHVALHLVPHRLLLARTSAFPKAVPPVLFSLVDLRPRKPGLACLKSARSKAQPLLCPSLRDEAGDTMLVPTRAVAHASARGQSRGKGVLAA